VGEDESDRIFKMGHDRRGPRFSLNRNHINLPVVDFLVRCVILGAGDHVFALPRGDVIFGEKFLSGGEGFYLYEQSGLPLSADEIDLAVGSSNIAGDDGYASTDKELTRDVLAPGANGFFITCHVRIRSSMLRRRTDQLPLYGFARCTSFS